MPRLHSKWRSLLIDLLFTATAVDVIMPEQILLLQILLLQLWSL